MSNSNIRFVNPRRVPRLDYLGFIVERDGAVQFGRITNASVNRSSTDDTLDNYQGGRARTAIRERIREDMSLTMATREIKSRLLLNFFHSEGRAPIVRDYEQLLCTKYVKEYLRDYQADVPVIAGLPQTQTQFPAPNSIAASATGSSAIPAATYYAWVVPVFINRDPIHGITTANFTLGNVGNYRRGFHYVCGTPTASDSQALSGSNALQVDWQDPLTGPRPDYYFVVVGSSDDITAGTSHISAVVAFGSVTALITALGTVDFGDSPAIADFHDCAIGSVTSEARVWTAKSKGVDYNFNAEKGLYTAVASASPGISDGALHMFTNWLLVNNQSIHEVGGSDVSEMYKAIRLIHASPSTTDPDTRRPNMIILDFYRANLAGIPMDMLASAPDGFAPPLNLTLSLDHDSSRGVFGHAYISGEDNFVDMYSNDIAAAAA